MLKIIIASFAALFTLYLSTITANAGEYLNSSHGDSVIGVQRPIMATDGYARGNCSHCHEQHASLDGAEPIPTGGPDAHALFYSTFVSQADNFCLRCHTSVGGDQSGGGITNRSYSYRAGGWSFSSITDILSAFSYTSPASSHNLNDIRLFIDNKWGFTANSSPCAACHNPHAVQGDPENSPSGFKTSSSRGYPVSRPALHNTNPWGLWGDVASERMNAYTLNYQAPYRYNSTSTYEPDGSTTQNGSNLTDFPTLCTDCHNTVNTIYSSNLGRNLRKIDWNNEKHGKGDADVSLCGDNPYPSGATGLGKVLSCLDCHEPHGSPNAFLIRQEVNGGVLAGNIGSFATTNWHYLCDRCHQDDKEIDPSCQEDHYFISHHASSTGCATDRAYSASRCGSCHGGGGGGFPSCNSGNAKKVCTDCHFHGSVDPYNSSKRTF